MIATDALDVLNVSIAALAAIAAAVATFFSWLAIKWQRENEREQYVRQMLARHGSADFQEDLDLFAEWVSMHGDFLQEIEAGWPDYAVTDEEESSMREIGPQSAVLYHFFKDVFDYYESGFITTKHLKRFKELRSYRLLIEYERPLSKQFFKDLNGEAPTKVAHRHQWIDRFEEV